ncbi:MAG: HPP family protein, partial [Gammaproteobacteria bacterium]|nr:HPP family protein [Gammaproteobacteria bacterium]
GERFVLFPPLVVIGYEMFVHPDSCPWAAKPLHLPVACFLAAAAGLLCWHFLGTGPAAAVASMALGIIIVRAGRLQLPPALAIALLPQVMHSPDLAYPFAILLGTLLLSAWFLLYRRFS